MFVELVCGVVVVVVVVVLPADEVPFVWLVVPFVVVVPVEVVELPEPDVFVVVFVLVLGDVGFFAVSRPFSMAFLVDWAAFEPTCLVVSTTLSTFGWRQNSSQSTNQTRAARTSRETIAQIIRPMIETLFCSYMLYILQIMAVIVSERLQKCNITVLKMHCLAKAYQWLKT